MQTPLSPQTVVSLPPVDFTRMLEALKKSLQVEANRAEKEDAVTLIQTHASAVLLSATHVYKLKKPKNFGFFDYSTPLLRRHFCQQEVDLNRSLAPHIYLGVAPILLSKTDAEQMHFGAIVAPELVPEPGAVLDEGIVVDYAVIMVRLPDAASLEARVQANTADPQLLSAIAHTIAAFHQRGLQNEQSAQWGSCDVIRQNWEENFAQIQLYLERTISASSYERIASYVHRMLEERAALFETRVCTGRICDCHGDLRLQHVYLLEPETTGDQTKLAIIDRIEFNDRFRYSDVASEVAFLAMELDAAGRSDLSRAFIDAYIRETGDSVLHEVLPFYACYRAFVRGKVLSFQLDEQEVPVSQRERAAQQAKELFALAEHYATGPTRPTLLMIGGLMGTGKSTLATAIQRELDWSLASSDLIRKRLASLHPAHPQPDAFGQGIYSAHWSERTYEALREEAWKALVSGRSVILDASFSKSVHRKSILEEASELGADTIFVECRCPREITLKRLTHRWHTRLEMSQWKETPQLSASDGRPELYQAQVDAWEDFFGGKELASHHVIETVQPVPVTVERVLALLHMPRLACWLTSPLQGRNGSVRES